MHICISAY